MYRFLRATMALAACTLWASNAAAQPLYSNASPNPAVPQLNAQAVSDSGVPAPAGSFWSEVENDAGNTAQSNTNAGYSGHRVNTPPPVGTAVGQFRLADDFTVTGPGWNITSIQTYGYQTNLVGTVSPVNGGNLRIWSGRPGDPGSTVIFGDTTTNRLTNSVATNIFRVFNTTTPPPGAPPNQLRRLFEHTMSVGTTLAPGTYWVDFQMVKTNTSDAVAHFMPAATLNDARTAPGWNARQLVTTGTGTNTQPSWIDAIDIGNPSAATPDVAQDMPFIINGTIVPEPLAISMLGLGALTLLRRRRA